MSNQEAIKKRYTFGNDGFSLEAAYHDCKLVFDGITDNDSFQKADTGVILYFANEIIYALHEALQGRDTDVPSNDLISRQAALDALGEAPEVWMDTPEEFATLNQWEYDVAAIEAVPSVQPEHLVKESSDLVKDLVNDYISRQKAIDAINALHEKPNAWLDYAVDVMMTLPSAQPKTGRWIRCKEQDKADLDNGNALYKCSNCGHTDLQAETKEVPYCWYCGADMRGEKDG